MMDTPFPACQIIEAVLFASPEPVSRAVLSRYLPPGLRLEDILTELQKHYQGRGICLINIGDSWAFRTAPELAPHLAPLLTVPRRLSRPALETLAIIAYHQPVTRPEIEDIRGVSIHRGLLDVLVEAGWITPGARREVPGRPLTWVTTTAFLDHFALSSLDELPSKPELIAAGLLDARPINVTLFDQLIAEEQTS
jgi:segregation and condensation protein B